MGAGGKIATPTDFPGANLSARVRAGVWTAWVRLTPRERRLAMLAALLALAVAAFSALGWSQDQRERYAAAQADLMLARQLRHAARGGLDRVQRVQLASVSDWSTRDRNIWLARIRLEQAVAQAAAQAGAPDPEIQVAEDLEGDSALPLVRAEVSGPYVAGSFAALLRNLADDPHAMVVQRLEIGDTETARYRLSLLFPVDIGAEQPS
ncbi:hypothetical protein EV278_11756 [Caulobacter sp. BK020]|nr:hypothetical protein EV278_11756 [Caulobacter sp. BK020]